MIDLKNNNIIQESLDTLKDYCESEKFEGWDPYDGLNSELFRKLGFNRNYYLRLGWIQLFKRSPINFRRLAVVKKGYNPKGLGLFLSAYCNLYKISNEKTTLDKINYLANKLIELKTDGYSGSCWGYNFDWQSRLEFMPDKTPTVVVTSFVANSLMDAYDITKNRIYLQHAVDSCNFIINDLNHSETEKGIIFSYSPLDVMQVYNASLLGSRLLTRVYSYNGDSSLIELARKSVEACCAVQENDGSWRFGSNKVQSWKDSFHTGFNLESISEYVKYSEDNTFNKNLEKGLKYYVSNFFLKDGTPKYYNDKINPIDIHCPAQFAATISKMGVFNEHSKILKKTLEWTINRMQNKDKGFFYYQINQGIPSKIPYMRWAQAWMMYGMSYYMLESKKQNG